MSERRNVDRRRVIKSCRVLFNDRRSSFDCVVRNKSADGARLTVESAHLTPDEVELLIMQEGMIYPCKVAWRRGSDMGVQFTGAAMDA